MPISVCDIKRSGMAVRMKQEKESGKKLNAVMTVEASLILPVFIMLFMNVLSIVEVYRIHSSVAESLWDEGRKTAKYCYLKEVAENISGFQESDISGIEVLAAALSGSSEIVKDLGNYPVWEKIVDGGKSGFWVNRKTEDNGMISIDCGYRIHPLFMSLTPISKEIENHYYGHAWIGYVLGDGKNVEGEDEVYVYITETGTVYHRNRGCSYLNPSIRSVNVDNLDSARNNGGAVYYACPLCKDMAEGENCYVTDYGTSYHTSITCSGLKRTIYEVKLSEVGGRSTCSKCGG